MVGFLKRYYIHLLLILILTLGFLARVYRLDMLLRFYYDQGRDAIVIHDIIHKLRPVLVGPTTGLAGIMRGPAFYYLLLPAYLVGRGDPVIAAVWLQLLNTFGLFVIIVNAMTLYILDIVSQPLTIQGYLPLIYASLIIGIINFVIGASGKLAYKQ